MCASAPPVGWFRRAFLANLGNARAIGGRDVEGREWLTQSGRQDARRLRRLRRAARCARPTTRRWRNSAISSEPSWLSARRRPRTPGLTPQQHQALLAIKGLADPDGASVGDIAGFLLIRHHTAVELVDRMAKLKLIGREADPEDARRVLVKLTAKGEQKLRSLSRIHLDELSAAAPALAKILRSFKAETR